jgi:hypothetical protein
MKLTVKDVAKLSGLSESTIRVYSWRKKLGTVEGGKKYFTRAEVSKMSKAAKSEEHAKGKPVKAKPPKPALKVKEEPKPEPKKPSFWRFLGFKEKKQG